MPTFSEQFEQKPKTSSSLETAQTKNYFLSKVFGMMFVQLLITFLVAIIFAIGLAYWASIDTTSDAPVTALLITLVASAIGCMIMSFVLPIKFIRNKSNILVPTIIYNVFMGLMLSSFVLFIDWQLIALALGITALVFGIMALLGYVSKGKLSALGLTISGLLIGVLLIYLINMVLYWVNSPLYSTLSWVVSFAFFAIIMFITIYDVARIKQIANSGENSQNMLLYCSFVLYSDFISIFVRILYYLLIIFSNKK